MSLAYIVIILSLSAVVGALTFSTIYLHMMSRKSHKFQIDSSKLTAEGLRSLNDMCTELAKEVVELAQQMKDLRNDIDRKRPEN